MPECCQGFGGLGSIVCALQQLSVWVRTIVHTAGVRLG